MPKKFKGENSKAAEARAIKEAKRLEEKERKEKAIADEYWKDDDKHVQRKLQRKDDKERKKQELQDRKLQLKQLEEDEMASIKSCKPVAPTKVSRAEVEANRERITTAAAKSRANEEIPYDEQPIEENINRLLPEGDEARTVEDAISVLSVQDAELERHPERRLKAAYTAYEDRNLPILKQENPNMRLSQLKQMLKKDWMKSPENPLNQRNATYNSSRR